MPRSPRASASPVRVQPSSLRVLAGLLVVAALPVVLSACAPDPSTPFDPPATGTSTVTAQPSADPTATPTATAAPVPTETGSTTPPDTRAQVDVVIVNWGGGSGEVHASGIVPGLVESGGTCTLTAAAVDGTSHTASRDAQPATDSTDCGVISVDVGQGDWTISLSYESPESAGVSGPQTASAS